MTLTIHIDDALDRLLESAAQREGVTKDELVQHWIKACASAQPTGPSGSDRPTLWDAGQGFFGQVGSGDATLSERVESIVREKIHDRTHRG